MKKKFLKEVPSTIGKNKFIFSHLANFEPEARIQSNNRGNGFKLSAIKVWKSVFQGLPSDL